MICSRAGCGKKLRSNNTRGFCGNGCLSLDAAPSMRAPHLRGVKRGDPAPKRPASPKKPAHAPRGERPVVGEKMRLNVGDSEKIALKKKEIHYSDDKRTPAEKTLEEFKTVATALGKDPKAMLAESARAWLDAVHAAIAGLDELAADEAEHPVVTALGRGRTLDESVDSPEVADPAETGTDGD